MLPPVELTVNVITLSPVFGLYPDPAGAVQAQLDEAVRRTLPLQATDHLGVVNRLWPVTDQHVVSTVTGQMGPKPVFIADGHHRYETALNFRNKQRQDHPEAPPDAAFNYVLMLLVDVADPGLTILPTHRLLHDFERFNPALVEQLSGRHRVISRPDRGALLAAMQEPTPGHRISIALAQTPARFFSVDLERAGAADPVSQLDVSVLHREILQRELGLEPAELESERYLSYSRDVDAVLDRVESGAAQAAFLLRPPAVSDVVEVARAGPPLVVARITSNAPMEPIRVRTALAVIAGARRGSLTRVTRFHSLAPSGRLLPGCSGQP